MLRSVPANSAQKMGNVMPNNLATSHLFFIENVGEILVQRQVHAKNPL